MTTLAKVLALVSGQGAWIGRKDCHVYCHHPMREVMGDHGRTVWKRFPEDARYSLICPDAGHDDHHWTTAADVAALIDAILAQESRHVA